LEINNNHSFLSEQEIFFSSYQNTVIKSDYDHSMYDTPFSWNNINSCIDSYFHSQICVDSCIFGNIVEYNDSDLSLSNNKKSNSRTIKIIKHGWLSLYVKPIYLFITHSFVYTIKI